MGKRVLTFRPERGGHPLDRATADPPVSRQVPATLFTLFVLATVLLWPSGGRAQCTNCTTIQVGADTVHTFTSGSGTFTPPTGVTQVNYLVVGGGGGGGGIPNGGNFGGGGGGGAGGFLSGSLAVTPSQTYNISVGAGGGGGVGGASQGGNGGNSSFDAITANGGGGGASADVNNDGEDGASGGGARINNNTGGSGIAGQGNTGGDGANGAGGGGGAGVAGADGQGNNGGDGGDGLPSSITGAAATYAGGGGGGSYNGNTGGTGGTGGGGSSPDFRAPGGDAAANTGGGGGGASGGNGGPAAQGGDGGSGIVVIRYTPPPHYYSRTSGSWTGNNRWSLAGCGGASAGNAEPGPGDTVTICNGDTISLNTSIGGAGLVSIQIQGGGVLEMANNNTARSLTVAGSITNDGTLIMPTGRNTTSSLLIGGDLVNNGSVNLATDADSLVDTTFNGTTVQTISGSGGTTFYNLALNNANGLSFGGSHNVTVNNTVTLTDGRITTGAAYLYVASGNAVAGAAADRFIVGNLRKRYTTGTNVDRVFEVGTVTGGVLYAPVLVRLGNVTGAGDFTVSTTAGDHPNIAASTLDPNLSINRYWTLTNNSVTFTADAATGAWFIYNDPEDYDAGADYNEFYVARHNGGSWTEITPATRAATGAIIVGAQFTMTTFPGDYQIAEQAPVGATCNTSLAPGLPGEYFDNMTLAGTPDDTRVDGPVDFDWGGGGPAVTGVGNNNFSVRWEGLVRADVTGNYRFQTVSDDGVRLWVNGVQVIDNWTDHAATTDTSANVGLIAGEIYDIRLEFYENGGQAEIRLRWEPPGASGFSPIPAGPSPTPGAGLYYCTAPIPGLQASYRMDEAAWNGTADEVQDASGNARHGTAAGGADTDDTSRAIPGDPGTCGYGQFDGTDDYVQVPNLSTLLNGTASLAFWIRTTQTGSDTNWQSPGVAGVEQSGGTDDIFWGWLDAGGHIGISVGDVDDVTTRSTVPINSGTWRHVVLTRDHVAGEFNIYIDGNLNQNGSIATGTIGTVYASIGRIEDTGGSPEYFDGELDEIRIYDTVLTESQAAAVRAETHPCGPSIDHIRIQHDGEGLTCAPEQVTVLACQNADCSTQYTGDVTTTLSPSGWVGGDTVTFNGGSTTASLRRTTVSTVTLDAGSTTPTAANATRCFISGTEDCSMDFVESGFIFDVPDLTACRPSADITITAVKTADNGETCVPAFSGSRTVGFWSDYSDPTTGTQSVSVSGTAVGTASPGTGITLNFNASAEATFTVTYPDAGQMHLNARYEGSGTEAGLVMTGSDPFTSVPVGLAVYTNAPNCDAVDANGPVCGIAGNAFPLTVKAACWISDADTDLSDNPETPNFQMNAIPMSHTLSAPGGGVPGTPGTGTFDITAADNGVATFNQTVSEVGIFTFTATPPAGGYFGQTVPAGTSPDIGRFRPSHFDMSGGALVNRIDTGCPAPTFTYMGENLELGFNLAAENSSGATTQNYTGAFVKMTPIDAGNLNVGAIDTDTPTPLTPRLTVSSVNGGWGNGTGTAGVIAHVLIDRNPTGPDGPYDNLLFGVAPSDSDGVTLATFNLDADDSGTAERRRINDDSAPAPTEVRYGRMFAESPSGSELLPLTLPLYVQYWDGNGFVRNTDDSCTAYDGTDLNLTNRQGDLTSNPTVAGNGTFINGAFDPNNPITLDSNNESGSIDFELELPTYPFLYFDWPRDDLDGAYDDEPEGKATFGIFEQNSRQIYLREVY